MGLLDGFVNGHSLFDEKKALGAALKQLIGGSIITNILMWIVVCLMLSYGWNPPTYNHNLAIAIVNNDFPPNDTSIRIPPVGFFITGILTSEVPRPYGWHVIPPDTFDSVQRRVHHGEFWAAIYIPENYTINLNASLLYPNGHLSSNPPPFTEFVSLIISLGRHIPTCGDLIGDFVGRFGGISGAYTGTIVGTYGLFYSNWRRNNGGQGARVASYSALNLPIPLVPYTTELVYGQGAHDSTGIGYILLFIVSAAAVNIVSAGTEPLQKAKVKPLHTIFLRVLWTTINGFLLALSYTGCIASFGLDIRHGFVTLWMWNWLAVSTWSVFIAFLVVMFGPLSQVLSIIMLVFEFACSGSIATLEREPGFYQIGRGLIMFNAGQGARHLVFDAYKRISTNSGVLLAWFFGYLILTIGANFISFSSKIENPPGPLQVVFKAIFATTLQPRAASSSAADDIQLDNLPSA